MLFGSSWIEPSGSTKGLATHGGNMAMIMKYSSVLRLAMHEVLHIFYCHTATQSHVTDFGGYIMWSGGDSPPWPFGYPADHMHIATAATLMDNINKFNGFNWS